MRSRARGNWWRKRVTASGTITIAARGPTPNVTEPALSLPICATSSSALLSSTCAMRARAKNARPDGVGTMPCGVRWKSRECNSASRLRTLLVMAGCDTPSLRAAPRMLLDSTTATKFWICLRRMGDNPPVIVVDAQPSYFETTRSGLLRLPSSGGEDEDRSTHLTDCWLDAGADSLSSPRPAGFRPVADLPEQAGSRDR